MADQIQEMYSICDKLYRDRDLMPVILQLDTIYGVSRVQPSLNQIVLVLSMKTLVTDLKGDDLQGLPTEEIRKSQILDIVSTTRRFVNVVEDNSEEWLQSDVCELSFQHVDSVKPATTQKEEEEGDKRS
jgi:hypothetical protein